MKIDEMPKIVLHLHLDGSLDLDTAFKWCMEDGIKISKKELIREMQVNEECHSLNDYLKKFILPCKLLQTSERLTEATYKIFVKLAKLNVVYAEVRFAPNKHLEKGMDLESAVESVILGMNRAMKEVSIDGGIILCLMRGDSNEDNLKIIDVAKKYLEKGVLGIDLAGAEVLFPTEDYADLFVYAKSLNIPFTIHAGEAGKINDIDSALNFGTKRIGHGIKSAEDELIQNRLISNNVLLEICVTSNYQTKAVNGIHPLEKLYNKGIKISINTDNDTVSNININKEYEKVLNETKLGYDDLLKCNMESIPFIFANKDIKTKLQKILLDFKNSKK